MIVETLIKFIEIYGSTHRQFADNLKCDGYADRQHTSNITEFIIQSWEKDISASGIDMQKTILLKK